MHSSVYQNKRLPEMCGVPSVRGASTVEATGLPNQHANHVLGSQGPRAVHDTLYFINTCLSFPAINGPDLRNH